jgi:hypothetical protein
MIKEKYGYDQFTLQMPYGECEGYIRVNNMYERAQVSKLIYTQSFDGNAKTRQKFPGVFERHDMLYNTRLSFTILVLQFVKIAY